MRVKIGEEQLGFDLQCLEQTDQSGQPNLPHSTLDPGDLGHRQTGSVGQYLLRPALLEPGRPDVPSENLQGVHSPPSSWDLTNPSRTNPVTLMTNGG